MNFFLKIVSKEFNYCFFDISASHSSCPIDWISFYFKRKKRKSKDFELERYLKTAMNMVL